MATKAMKAIQAKTATKTMSTDRATKAKTAMKTMSTRAMKAMKAKTALKTMSKKAKKTTGGLKKQDLTTLKAKKGMKTTNAMKSAGTQAVSPKRFRAANPPHDHDDKTKYHDDDLIKYQWTQGPGTQGLEETNHRPKWKSLSPSATRTGGLKKQDLTTLKAKKWKSLQPERDDDWTPGWEPIVLGWCPKFKYVMIEKESVDL